jgi:small subunit ribosomal protein S4
VWFTGKLAAWPKHHGQNIYYGLHLKAKQKNKCHYGRVYERQFRNIFGLAQKMKGNTGENFVGLLERRLDMVVYRLNLAPTIFAARQLVAHGHIKVNGKKVNIPSQRLDESNLVELKESSKQIPVVLETATKQSRTVPAYLSFDNNTMSGKFVKVPMISDVPYPFEPERINLVVELYSR